jgi:hypothetical protein
LSKRDWTKLDDDWAGNRKVKKLMRKYGPVAGAYWTLIIAKAHADSHHLDNPTGVIHTTRQDLADELCDRHDRATMMQAMIDAKLVRVKGRDWTTDPEADIAVELVDSSWVTPKGGTANRQKLHREKVRSEQGQVTDASRLHNGGVTQTKTETKTSKLASPPEILEFLVRLHPTMSFGADGLTQQLTEFVIGDSRPSPQNVLDAALEVGPTIKYPGKAFTLVSARARSLKQGEPGEVPAYTPPPEALAFQRSEGLAS